MKKTYWMVMVSIMALATMVLADELDDGFRSPHDSARPWVYWFWINGNITREGITADLEAMKRVGIGGVLIMEVDCGDVPTGPVAFMGPQWRDMFKHAVVEAKRLGLEVSMNNDAGYTGSGGPWIKPEQAMQKVVWSETRLEGGKRFAGPLPTPPGNTQFEEHTRVATARGEALPSPADNTFFYRDIAMMAVPTPADEVVQMKDLPVRLTTSAETNDVRLPFTLPRPEPGKPQYMQAEFTEPLAAYGLELSATPGGMTLQVQTSADGREFKTVYEGVIGCPLTLRFDRVSARYYRLLFTKTDDSGTEKLTIRELRLLSGYRIENIEGKTAAIAMQVSPDAPRTELPAELVIPQTRIVDLTAQMDKDGRLVWEAPPGHWTVLRIGHAMTGAQNHPAPMSGRGWECDKLSKNAIETHFAAMMDKLVDDCQVKVGDKTGLVATHIDSWEVGSQNWTAQMREEFRKRRGYDLLPFLPVMTGRVVDSLEVSERFLWDLRQTISDLLVENYAGHLQELAHQRGLRLSVEAYGEPADNLTYAGRADEPMTEFWAGDEPPNDKGMSSGAHTYGRRIVGAEAFTAPPDEKWRRHPATVKFLGDGAFCLGINRLVVHRYAMQPWLNYRPGMTMTHWGLHYERTQTWWELSRPWHEYLARCQFLLRQGLFAADICYLQPELAPQGAQLHGRTSYDYDDCSPEVVLTRMSVKDGRIVLPDGMSYRLLALTSGTTMTSTLLRKITSLVEAGATVVGARPSRSPGLSDYPKCDEDVKRLADELWGNCDGTTVKERVVGKGRIICGSSPEEILAAKGVPPDFEYANSKGNLRLDYIHRAVGQTDIYFVANLRNASRDVECTFRVNGKIPELWHADSGMIEPAPVYVEKDGRTTIPLSFDPNGSVFVVFREQKNVPDHIVALKHTQAVAGDTHKLQISKAIYEALDGAGAADVTATVAGLVKDGELNVRVASLPDPTVGHQKQLRIEYVLDGKNETRTVFDSATLDIRGREALRAFDLSLAESGKLRINAWQPGIFEWQTATGKTGKIEAKDVFQPVAIEGSWELRFPPNGGAPERVTLEKLISWSEHADPGVKYFSGTATYHKTITVPNELLGKDCRLYLDLGDVQVIAKLKLNGRDLGILWKPPFRVEITKAVKAGDNELDISVVNLWPNRMIGDEQLPKDKEGYPGVWPKWLLEGKPSPTGRHTFATWQPWRKDDPLLESGLLGPVKLVSTKTIHIEI